MKNFLLSFWNSVTKSTILSSKDLSKSIKKSKSFFSNIDNHIINLIKKIQFFKEKAKTPAQNNYELGLDYFLKGDYKNSIMRFKLSLLFSKNDPKCFYYMGRCYLALINMYKAQLYFNKIGFDKTEFNKVEFDKIESIESNLLDFDYFRNLVNKKTLPCPSPELVKEFFNHFAKIFDKLYKKHYSYKGYSIIHTKYKDFVPDIVENFFTNESKINTLELGCGSGELAYLIKADFPNHELEGIDFSPKMIEQAKQITISQSNIAELDIIDRTNINPNDPEQEQIDNNIIYVYKKLIQRDIYVSLKNLPSNHYHFIIARGILNYIENPKKLIKEIARILKTNGLLFFYITEEITSSLEQEISTKQSFPFYLKSRVHSLETIEEYITHAGLKKELSQIFLLEKKIEANFILAAKKE